MSFENILAIISLLFMCKQNEPSRAKQNRKPAPNLRFFGVLLLLSIGNSMGIVYCLQ